jgi:hypothetical protein
MKLVSLPEAYAGFLALDEGRNPIMIDVRLRNFAEGAPLALPISRTFGSNPNIAAAE